MPKKVTWKCRKCGAEVTNLGTEIKLCENCGGRWTYGKIDETLTAKDRRLCSCTENNCCCTFMTHNENRICDFCQDGHHIEPDDNMKLVLTKYRVYKDARFAHCDYHRDVWGLNEGELPGEVCPTGSDPEECKISYGYVAEYDAGTGYGLGPVDADCPGPKLCLKILTVDSCPGCPYKEDLEKKIQEWVAKLPDDFDPFPDKR